MTILNIVMNMILHLSLWALLATVYVSSFAQEFEGPLYDPVPHSHAHRHKLAKQAKKALNEILKNDPSIKKAEKGGAPQSTEPVRRKTLEMRRKQRQANKRRSRKNI
jgi:hypothetical protein